MDFAHVIVTKSLVASECYQSCRQRKLFDKKENKIRSFLFLFLLTFLDIIGILIVRRGINSSFFFFRSTLWKKETTKKRKAHTISIDHMIYGRNVIYVYVTTAMINFERYNYHVWITRTRQRTLSWRHWLNELNVRSNFHADFMHRVLFQSIHLKSIYAVQNDENLSEHLERSLITL